MALSCRAKDSLQLPFNIAMLHTEMIFLLVKWWFWANSNRILTSGAPKKTVTQCCVWKPMWPFGWMFLSDPLVLES